jgi:uridine kinase
VRAALLERLAAAIAEVEPQPRVAVDGIDAAGKTTLADELAGMLERRGRLVARISEDDFLRPREERYARGELSPEGYYLDSFDHGALRAAVLAATADALVVVDGVFLQRPELADCWDLVVFVSVQPEEALRRALERDRALFGKATEERYRRRYLPGQELYEHAVHPRERADFVLENEDPQRPRLVVGGRFDEWPRAGRARTIA